VTHMSRKKIAGLLLLIIVFGFIIRLNIFGIPFERDEGAYAYNAWLITSGKGTPYVDTFEQKLPGVLFMYALLISIFGEGPGAVHIGTYFYSIITVAGLFFLASSIFDRRAGIAAAFLYVVFSSAKCVDGFSSNTEIFMIMPMVISTLLAVLACRHKRFVLFIRAGFLCGLAFMFKQVAASNIVAVYMFHHFLRSKDRKLRALFFEYLLLFVSFWIPILCFVAYLHAKGALTEAYYQTFIFSIEYRSLANRLLGIRYGVLGQVSSPFVLYWFLGLCGLVIMIFKRTKGLFFAAGFFLFSLAGVMMGYMYYPHYFMQMAPAVSLLGGWAVAHVFQFLEKRKIAATRSDRAILVAVLIVFILIPPALDAVVSILLWNLLMLPGT